MLLSLQVISGRTSFLRRSFLKHEEEESLDGTTTKIQFNSWNFKTLDHHKEFCQSHLQKRNRVTVLHEKLFFTKHENANKS